MRSQAAFRRPTDTRAFLAVRDDFVRCGACGGGVPASLVAGIQGLMRGALGVMGRLLPEQAQFLGEALVIAEVEARKSLAAVYPTMLLATGFRSLHTLARAWEIGGEIDPRVIVEQTDQEVVAFNRAMAFLHDLTILGSWRAIAAPAEGGGPASEGLQAQRREAWRRQVKAEADALMRMHRAAAAKYKVAAKLPARSAADFRKRGAA